MKYIKVDYIICCDDNFNVIKDGAIVFDNKIIDFGKYSDISQKYTNEFVYQGANSILMPAFINSHTHLEFCNHKNTFVYGNFTLWLKSVIFNTSPRANKEQIKKELDNILNCGVGSIGAISSFGEDIDICAKHKINVVLFNEILGSKKEMFENIKNSFTNRLNKCLALKNENENDTFIPAISVHSPYSTNKTLAKWAIKKANKYKLSISSHFLESKDENVYIDTNIKKCKMQKFFKNSLGLSKKNYNNSMEFLELFDKFKPLSNNGFDSVLSFVHCNLAKKKHIKKIKKLQASIVHCPKSNKLLGNPLLELSKIYQISKKNISKTNTPKQGTKQKINISIATDGLSSNNSSNIIDELKSAIFMHITNTYKNIYKFANALMLYGTKNGAIVLGLKKGIIKKNYDSDLIIFNLNTTPIKKHIALDVILNISKNNIQKMYLKGKLVF